MPRPPSPSSSDLFITGISEYLTSPVFLDSINSYVESHCCMFDVSNDYSPGEIDLIELLSDDEDEEASRRAWLCGRNERNS